MRPKRQTEVEQVLAAMVRSPRKAGRSTLYRWLRANHAKLLLGLQDDRPDWTLLCEQFTRIGLTDRTGKPATPGTARKTWQRVRHDVAKAGKRQLREPIEPTGRTVSNAAVPPPPPTRVAEPESVATRPKRELRFATLKGAPPPLAIPPPAPVEPSQVPPAKPIEGKK